MIPTDNDLLILQDSLERVRGLCGYKMPWVRPEDFSEIVVILGSSRSGSSLLFQMLSSTGLFWAPPGEETPIFRTTGLGWIEHTKESDVLSSILPENAKEQIRQALFCELGRGSADEVTPAHLDQMVRRLLWQWPDEDFRLNDVVELARKHPAWPELIQRLGLEEGYYDVPGLRVNRRSQLALPEWFIEEPPFVAPFPRETPQPADLRNSPVLLKTTTHAYRVPLLKTLFPASRFKFIVLTRNPAAGINGLMDGWLSNAFHSHNLSGVKELDIDGYTNVVPQGGQWWKFDLPPGWSEYATQPLVDVCAFQWRSAYAHILSQTQTLNDPILRVKHEDLVSPQKSDKEFARLFEFLGLSAPADLGWRTTRPVMASENPAPARWRRREDLILPTLAAHDIRSVADRLDYDLDSPESLL